MKPFMGLVLAALATVVVAVEPASATSWGLNSFGDEVQWTDSIVVAKVKTVKKVVQRAKAPRGGKHLGYATVTVEVLERLKGDVPDEIRVTKVDLGDPTTMVSPRLPLPANLVDQKLVLFLRGKAGPVRECFERALLDGETIVNLAVDDGRNLRLQDFRAMVAQLLLIQSVCPIRKQRGAKVGPALAACRTALHSQYRQVVRYGAARLWSYDIPADYVSDLAEAAEREGKRSPILRLLVMCIAKIKNQSGGPALICLLRTHPKDKDRYNHEVVQKALKDLTGQDFGGDVDKWKAWWNANRP